MALDKTGLNLVKKHPMQALPSPSRDLSAVLHTVGLASFTYSFSYLVSHPTHINESYGWHLQYLTIIGLSLATGTFIVGLLADLTLSRRLFRIKNALSVASAPMECLITILYWSIRAIDKSLVFPDWAPPLETHADLSFHAMPAIALVIDLLFFSPPYTIAFLPTLSLSGAIAFGYWFWVEQCYRYNKFYPYPLFGVLNQAQRAGLFAFSALLMTLSTMILIWLYRLVNGPAAREVGLTGQPRLAHSGNVKGE